MYVEDGRNIWEVGDVVKLKDIRPDEWNSQGYMDHWLGQIVTITRIQWSGNHDSCSTFYFAGSHDWSFRIHNIESLAVILSDEEKSAAKAERYEKYKTLGYLSDVNEIYKIAIDVFGEERTDMIKTDDYNASIVIFFPEVNISNSQGFTHTIKELYVKFDIKLTLAIDYIRSDISIYGRRTLISDYEFVSDYGHSHYSGIGITDYTEFCLGNSDFGMILQSMRVSSSESDWNLLFLSLENYVSWESLEGGPYRKIRNIHIDRGIDMGRYKYNALKLFRGIPETCLTFSDNKLQLNENHPDLYKYYDENSALKSFAETNIESFESLETKFKTRLPKSKFNFKGKPMICKLYMKEKLDDGTEIDRHLSLDVMTFYNNILKQELNKYNLSYGYYKNRNTEVFFREATIV